MRAILYTLVFVPGWALAQGNLERWRDPKPDLPDLSVRFIERLPRFPGTEVRYGKVDEPNGNRGDGLPAPI